jgi:hypothetical protein
MPYVPGSDATFVKLGPGKIYFGAVGAAEPADLTTAIGAAWTYAGFTEEGHTFTATPSYDSVEVAESLLPIARVKTGTDMTVEMALAEVTSGNVQKALNGATIASSGTGATAIDTVTPLADGVVETRVAILWEADDKSERWVWRKCLQTGAVAVGRKKGAAKATIPLSFALEPVSSTIRPFVAILKSTASIT